MTRRRDFLKGGAAAASALVLGVRLEGTEEAAAPRVQAFQPNLFVELRSDGRVLLTVAKSEMGQGVRTSLPMVLAEELDLPLERVELVQAMPGPDFRSLSTGGSTSVATTFSTLRQAGAAARAMLMAAAAERWKLPAEQCRTLDGAVLGPGERRAAYRDLVEAAARLPVPKDPKPKARAEHRLLGRSQRRFDGPRIVDGSAVYGLDLRVPGMKVAVVRRCPVFGGTVKAFEAAKALAVPGVLRVLQVPSGLAVLADTTAQALAGAEALQVSWDEGPQAAFSSVRFWASLDRAGEGPGKPVRAEGKPPQEGLLRGQVRMAEAEYRFPWQAHATMEPMNCLADVRAEGCEIRCGSQAPNRVQGDVAKALGLRPEQVKVRVTLLGGGFGRRLGSDFAVEAALVSKAAGCPVKVVWTREDDFRHDLYQPGSLHRLQGLLDEDGKPSFWQHRVVAPSILRSWIGGQDSPQIPQAECIGAEDFPYAVKNLLVEYNEAPTHVPLGWWRAIQIVPNVFARECFLDELAHLAKADPLAYRMELLGSGRRLKASRGELLVDRLVRVLAYAAHEAGWAKPLAPVPGRKVGRGIACHAYEGHTCLAHVAELSIGPAGDLKVHRVVTALDCGLVINPTGLRAQVEGGILWGLAALRSEVSFAKGRVEQTDFASFPLPRLSDMPQVEVHTVPSEAPPTGMGEPPVPPLLPAVLNAAFAATGRRVRTLPLRDADLAWG